MTWNSNINLMDLSFDCPVRLADGSSPLEGRVEVQFYDGWGGICDTDWSIEDGHVACKQLGYEGAEEVFSGSHFGSGGNQLILEGLRCHGNESQIVLCPHLGFLYASPACDGGREVGVRCRATQGKLMWGLMWGWWVVLFARPVFKIKVNRTKTDHLRPKPV